MALATKATRGAVGTNNWTNPSNATADDTTYATCAPGKNSSVIGDWDFLAFTDGELPVGSLIQSVVIRANYKVSTTISAASLGIANGNNGAFDTEETQATEPTSDADFDTTYNSPPSITDLKTTGRLVARIRGIRGNDNDAVTFSLDYVELRVTYVAPITGTGGVTLAAPSSSGTAKETMSGSGGVVILPPANAGTAKEAMVGSGAVSFLAPAVAADGTVTSTGATGTGAIAFAAPAIAGTGKEAFLGSGGVTLAAPAAASTAKETFVGSGGEVFLAPTLDGTGLVIVPVTGTGAVLIGGPSVSATGSGGVAAPVSGGGGRVGRWAGRRVGGLAPMPRVLIAGSAAVGISGPSISGRGEVNDDALALVLLI